MVSLTTEVEKIDSSDKLSIETEDGTTLYVQYNPSEITYNRDMKLGSDPEAPQFDGLEEGDLDITLKFSTIDEQEDVRDTTADFKDLQVPSISGTTSKRPPICTITWGSLEFRGILSKFQEKCTLFMSDGTPVFAEVGLTFKSILTDADVESFGGYEACRKLHTVTQGDRLDLLASRLLLNPQMWPIIADANGIEDPLRFPTKDDIGRVLVIPDPY